MVAPAMMVIGALEVAGMIAGVGMMFPSLFPEPPPDPDKITKIRIGAGLYGQNDTASASGSYPNIVLYDHFGKFVGKKTDGPHLDAQEKKSVQVDHVGEWEDHEGTKIGGAAGVAAEYMALSASSHDAICINFVSLFTPEGKEYGFLGDVGRLCGADWYMSDVPVVEWDIKDAEMAARAAVPLTQTSSCFWLDQNYSEKLRFQGMAIHLPDFSAKKTLEEDGRANQYRKDRRTMCDVPARLKFYEEMDDFTSISYFKDGLKYLSDNSDADINLVLDPAQSVPVMGQPPDPEPWEWTPSEKRDTSQKAPSPRGHTRHSKRTEQRKKKRQSGPPRRLFANTVIKSLRPEHRATSLCESDTSLGPDFVSLSEGLFCDMEHKHIWPLCSGEILHACFDVESNELRSDALGKREVDGKILPRKAYKEELKWGGLGN